MRNSKKVYRVLALLMTIVFSGPFCGYGKVNKNTIFKHLTIKDGLSESFILSIFKDNEGFMWFAAQNGLNRYDGYSFKVFRKNPDDSLPLPIDGIRAISEDNEKVLWFANAHLQLLAFDKKKEKFTLWKHPENNPTPKNALLKTMFADNDGHLWLMTNLGTIQLFDVKTHQFTYWEKDAHIPEELRQEKFNSLSKGKNGSVWLGCGNGKLIRFFYDRKKYDLFNINDGLSKKDPSMEIFSVQEKSNDKIWVSTSTGFFLLNSNSFTLHYYGSIINQDIKRIRFIVDKEGILWIGTEKGLSVFDPVSNALVSFKSNLDDPNAIHGASIVQMYEDNEGIMWISTRNNGLNIIARESNQFGSRRIKGFNAISSLLKEDDNNLLVGSLGQGLKIIHRDDSIENITPDGTRNFLKDDGVYFLYKDKKNSIWIGQDNSILTKYERQLKSFTRWKIPGVESSLNHFGGMVQHINESNDTLWISSYFDGMSVFDLKNNKYISWPGDSLLQNKIRGAMPEMSMFDKNGTLWLSTELGGLFKIDRKGGRLTFKNYTYSPKIKNGISANAVSWMLEDKPGFIWLGIYGGGLDYFDVKNEIFYPVSEKDGLSSNYVNTFLRDKKGRLWIGSDKGISCFTPQISRDGNRLIVKGVFKNYYEDDGLQSNEFGQNAAFQDSNGTLYFGGTNGINIFNPDSIRENNFSPPVFITGFRLFNKPVKNGFLKNAVEFTKELILPYTDNVFSFEFAALSFSNSLKNKYAYKMEGFDKDWTYTDATQRLATYTNLDPGEYTFTVIACNNDGVWNRKGASIHIIITPPFYRTWWFISLLILSVLCITIWIVRFASIRKYRKRFQEMEHQREIENVRSRIARDIHDDIGSGLTQISLIAEIVKSNEKRGKNTLHLVDKLNNSARTMIDNLGEIVWTINPKHDTINSLLSYFSNYISGFLGDTAINYTIDFHESSPDRTIHPELRRNLFMVLKEAIANIVKHSHAENVSFNFDVKENDFTMIITDDGTGIVAENESPFGNGLKNMKTRIQSIEGTIKISSNSLGTIIIIKGKIF